MSTASVPQQPVILGADVSSEGAQAQRIPLRRIRCRMCRQQLAGREQILQHGRDAVTSEPSNESVSEGGERGGAARVALDPVEEATKPILTNPACSGYFVEPLKWMDHFLQNGETSGKITCPNQRCKAKLGNFDWVGMQCGCQEWVIPGFCITQSKVDEVTIS